MALRVVHEVLGWRIWRVQKGQDLIEFALLAGFVTLGVGVIMTDVAPSISTIFSKVNSAVVAANR